MACVKLQKLYTFEEKTKRIIEKDKRLYKTYGITYQDWLEMSKNGCWMCGKTDGRLNVDHIHVPGFKKMPPEEKKKYVRGCLCFMDNTMLSGVEKRKDARKHLNNMIRYFSVFPMKGDLNE